MASRVTWSAALSPAYRAAELVECTPKPLPVTSLLDRFADELSKHGDIARAAAACRVPAGTGDMLFQRICRTLGSQAR